jgi:hypothetical protein
MSNNDLLQAEKDWINGAPVNPSSLQANLITTSIGANPGQIKKLRELLCIIHAIDFEGCADIGELKGNLPEWFTAHLPPPFSEKEMEQWLKTWRLADPVGKKLMEEKRGWPAEDWLYWMDPFNRPTYLVHSTPALDDRSDLIFASYELSQLNGATAWMLKNCSIEML